MNDRDLSYSKNRTLIDRLGKAKVSDFDLGVLVAL